MSANSIRPSISETSYRLFDRSLHPELFDPVVVGHVHSERGDLTIGICEGGHYLSFSHEGENLIEVTAPDQQQLSIFGLQKTYFYNNQEEVLHETNEPFPYHFAGEVDVVDFRVFTRVQLELEMECKKAFLSHQFAPQNRLFPGALSLVKVEGSQRMLSVHTFHTFPDDLAILRTQTLIEFG